MAVFVSHLMGNFLLPTLNLHDLTSQPNRKCDVSLDLILRGGLNTEDMRAIIRRQRLAKEPPRDTHAPRRKEHGLLSLPHFFCYCLHFGFDPAQLLLPATSALASPQPASQHSPPRLRLLLSLSLFFRSARVCLW